ncbi:hypothetical protein [Bacteroides caccae]|uniref:hypothetical protein n=1 Tax=Bacteroides caccae TaxID=47678 RepID=UPI00123121DA|nr:hypothetical protein [Bacteroides caccae]KAA5463635.1 hypothetical protein F2Y37_19665 [Bacteroides caccae]
MLKIKTNKGYLDLGGDFTVQIDEKSPVMNDRGSQTVPVTVPCTGKNAKITGFAHRLDMGIKPMNEDQACTVLDGAYKRTGKINIVSAGKKEGITLNIGFDNSEAYSAWKAKKLNAITLPVKEYSSVNSLCAHLQQVLGGYQTDDYAVFQIMTGNDSKDNQLYPKYLNYITPVSEGSKVYRLRYQARTETFLVNGTPTAVTLPEGYGVTAFLYVWRVLELVFSEFGYTITENPFKANKELSNLVILNNAADCCVKGKLSYADLMPDCTVEDFLNALHVRFGLVYNVSSDTKTATLRLIRDIVDDVPDIDLSRSLTDEPLITYETARQMKLSAKTSFTGAAPSVERFEDYLKDQEVARLAKVDITKRVIHLNYEETTGRWFKWDEDNKRLTYSSSSFFSWDRKTDNIEDNELTSDDECVPMDFAPNDILSPQYLADYVHRYTYLKTSSNNDDEDSEKVETPLSFVFAFTSSQNSKYPFGSVLPYTSEGEEVVLKDGSKHTISLLFQYKNGLFINFWKKYDAIIRHSFNQVETNVMLPIHQLMSMDILTPVALRGQHLLFDGLSYSLPANKIVPVDMTLRTLRLIAPYNLDEEHFIKDFGSTLYIWKLVRNTMTEVIENKKKEILDSFKKSEDTILSSFFQTNTDDYMTPDSDNYVIENPPILDNDKLIRNYQVKLRVYIDYIMGGPEDLRQTYDETFTLTYIGEFISVVYSG